MAKNNNPEDDELWKKVIKDATPLKKNLAAPKVLKKPNLQKQNIAQKPEIKVSVSGATQIKMADKVIAPSVMSDKKTLRKIKKLNFEPQSKLDLHGLTQAQAYEALEKFIDKSLHKKFKTILIITGKGRSLEGGILRKNLPLWLQTFSLSHKIVSYAQASQAHGGEGAYYVHLRTKEKIT